VTADAAPEVPAAGPSGGPPPSRRRRLDPLSLVAATVAVGVLIAALHHPRTGMFVVCGGLGAGALLRLVLSPRNAGLLVVRKRRVDVVVLLGLAVALGVLAAVTPFPAGQG
jgi:preprotein translocase subunit Sec61beta